MKGVRGQKSGLSRAKSREIRSQENRRHRSLAVAARIVVAVLAAVAWYPAPAMAESRAECRAVSSKILDRPVRYCVLLPPSYDAEAARRYPVLYYLHGLGDNEQSMVNRGGWSLVEQLWEQQQIGEFLIATPDGGRSFYINSRDGQERYEDFLVQEFIPVIERRYRIAGTPRLRAIGGTSMGGYGALRLAFKHPKLFASVAVHSAALIGEMPEDLAAGFGRSLRPFGEPFDPSFWNRNTPFALLPSPATLNGLKIYFDCGQQDDFGFDAGAQALHNLLQAKKIPHEFHLYPGRHDREYIAEHFDESLAFQSRVFQSQK